MIKVAFIDYVLEPDKPGRSGLSDIVWDIAGQLADYGFEPHIIGSYHTTDFPDKHITIHNFPEPLIGYRNLIGHLLILKKAAKIVKQLNPDIVHTVDYLSSAVMLSLGVKAPVVLTVPGNIFQRLAAKTGHSFEWHHLQLLKWGAHLSARKCAKVIATSKEMKYWWEKTGSKPDNTPLIPYGVNTNRFYFIKDAKQALHISSESLIFLYAGRFAREKAILELIDTVEKKRDTFRKSGSLVQLIGKGPQSSQVKQKIEDYKIGDFVKQLDWAKQDELPLWYSAADALLLPSYSEGFARVIAEAMICGTPVIGSRITGTEDVIVNDQNGYLFEPGKFDNLGEILQTVIHNPEKLVAMRSTTREYAKTNLTWEVITRRIIDEVYKPVLKSGL